MDAITPYIALGISIFTLILAWLKFSAVEKKEIGIKEDRLEIEKAKLDIEKAASEVNNSATIAHASAELVDDFRQERENLKKIIRELRENEAKNKEARLKLELRVSQSYERIHSLEGKTAEQQKWQEKLAELQERFTSLQSQLDAANRKIAYLEGRNEQLTIENKKLRDKLDRLNAKLARGLGK